MWECEFDALKKRQPEIARYLDTHPVMSRITLHPREAFFGERTENKVTSCTVQPGEEIKYTDICSLYSYVCKRDRFPIGHPQIYIGTEYNALTDGWNNNLISILPRNDILASTSAKKE